MNIIYELAFLISGQLDETQAQDLAKKIEKTLGDSGVIVSSTEPKKIKLAYLIKKQQEGFLVSIDFTAEPKFILLLSKEMEKETNVLRFLMIKKSAKKPEPMVKELEEKKEVITEKAKKPASVETMAGKGKTKKPASAPPEARTTAGKEEDLKKIEEDLDKILGIPDEDEPKAKSE